LKWPTIPSNLKIFLRFCQHVSGGQLVVLELNGRQHIVRACVDIGLFKAVCFCGISRVTLHKFVVYCNELPIDLRQRREVQ
jgi:hypothetical protein